MLDELGDVLFQVVFLSLLLEEEGKGSLEQVAEHCTQKLIRRHPHVFAGETAESAGEVLKKWDRIKLSEKSEDEAIFGDVPEVLPGLLYARKAQQRAASHGFDWPDVAGPLKKVNEELEELEQARTAEDTSDEGPAAIQRVYEEIGDVLFAVVNVARKLKADPEIALRDSARRFTERVELAEAEAEKDGKDWRSLDLDEQEHYYIKAKNESQ